MWYNKRKRKVGTNDGWRWNLFIIILMNSKPVTIEIEMTGKKYDNSIISHIQIIRHKTFGEKEFTDDEISYYSNLCKEQGMKFIEVNLDE